MQVPFYTGVREYSRKKTAFDKAIAEVLARGDYILGKEVTALENEIADYTGARYAVGVANGSDALLIALHSMGIGPGDEVITTPFTFFASVSAITRLGAVPVFTDIDAETFSMDVSMIEGAITEKTKAILPVHLFLQPSPMEQILALAKKHGLMVLEDAAEAFGMKASEKHAGTIGDAGIFSFYPTKTLGGYGDGGMIVTDDENIAARARSLRKHGETSQYYHREVGYNSRLDTLQAAVLRVKLRDIEHDILRRREIGESYTAAFDGTVPLKTPVVRNDVSPVYYVYSVITDKRDALRRHLTEAGVGNSIYYPLPLHIQECFAYLGYKRGDFPVAERTSETILSLPLFPDLLREETDYVIKTVKDFFKSS